jgi:hypothetical protein
VEARAWGLPIAASRQCGAVVIDRETGWLFSEVSAAAIAGVLREAVASPGLLREYAAAVQLTPSFSVDDLVFARPAGVPSGSFDPDAAR